MALDAFSNFAKVTVSIGYDASATSIVLTAGHGARLPAAPFNMTWWNSTDYADPSDDPNREIVRVTVIATDTLTVTRGQETGTGGLAASTKNTAAKVYKMVESITAKTLSTDLAATFQALDATLTSLAAYNTNGIVAQTAADTFAGRTITGTPNQVNVSNGSGVSGNPTLSTPQDIHTGASPTFAALSLTAPLAVTQGGTGSATAAAALTALGAQGIGLSAQIGSADTVTASVVGTTETPFALTYTVPANHFTTKRGIRTTIIFDITGTASPTLTLRCKLGGTTVFSSPAVVGVAATRGSGLQIISMGTATPGASVNVETGHITETQWQQANHGNNTAQPVALATNGTLALTFTAQWSANTAGNSITLRQLIVEPLTGL